MEDLRNPHPTLSPLVHDGLRLLIEREEAPVVANFWANVNRRLEAAPIADPELCFMICSGLDDLAWYLDRDGKHEQAKRWRDVSRQLKDRAWAREVNRTLGDK